MNPGMTDLPRTDDRRYLLIWLALVLLTGTTVGASFLPLRHLAILTCLLIATVKSALVVLYFMHGRQESRGFGLLLLCVLAVYVIFIGLTLFDYHTR